jgi:hypothetical protein
METSKRARRRKLDTEPRPTWSHRLLYFGGQGVLCQEDAKASSCTKDEGGPFGAALWGEASNSHKLLRSKAAVVDVMVKRRDDDHVM